MAVANKKTVLCPKCRGKAILEVSPDDWEDCPASFTAVIECEGRICQNKQYFPKITPEQVEKEFGLPKCGWQS